MISRVFSISASLLLTTSLTVHSEELSDRELREIGRNALQRLSDARGDRDKRESFRESLDGLTDSQKIRAIVYQVWESDDNPKYAMKSSNTMTTSYALGQDPDLIEDWTELGEMMKQEYSPRKFYLLSSLATVRTSTNHNGFIAERTHMLFADGRVAKDEGEYTRPYAHDVSEYAYAVILRSLRALEADFEPPAGNIPHEEQAVILAEWLRENWPGCQNIQIPRRLLGGEERSQRRPVEGNEISSSNRAERPHSESSVENDSWINRMPWMIGILCLTAVVSGFLLINRKA